MIHVYRFLKKPYKITRKLTVMKVLAYVTMTFTI